MITQVKTFLTESSASSSSVYRASEMAAAHPRRGDDDIQNNFCSWNIPSHLCHHPRARVRPPQPADNLNKMGRSSKKLKKSYSVLIASTGQDLAHFPHPVHISLSTTAIPWSFREMAPAGHSATQAPQPMHLFSSTVAGINLATA